MRSLTFDREAHVYRLGKTEVPGTTTLLRAAGLTEEVRYIPVEYRDAGSARHRWIEADLHGRLTKRTKVPPCVEPYLLAARRCLIETHAEVQAIEELICNRSVPYATCADVRVKWRGETWVWDWKTGGHYSFYPVQLALEVLCYRTVPRRACVFLTKDGTYSIDVRTGADDFMKARAVCQTWKALGPEERDRALHPWKYRDPAAADAVMEQAAQQDMKEGA